MSVRASRVGTHPAYQDHYIATTEAELLAIQCPMERSTGYAEDTQQAWKWGSGTWHLDSTKNTLFAPDALGNTIASNPILGNVRPKSMVYDLPVLRRKLADVGSGASEAIIGIIGDSHNAGVGSGDSGTYLLGNSFNFTPSAIMGRKLAAAFGLPVNEDGFWGWRGVYSNVALNVWDPRWAITGTWVATSAASESLGGGALRASTDGATATYTADRAWDKAEIWVQQNVGGTGTVVASATGASSIPLTMSGASPLLTKFTLTKSAVDLNPLVITATVQMSNYVGIAAINFINTKQPAVRIQNHAFSGSKMSDHIISARAYSSFNAYQTAGLSADLLLVELFHNSIKGEAQTMANWLANWDTFLAAMKTANRDIVVYIGFPGNFSWATDGTMDAWVGALKAKLDALSINLYDLRGIFGSSWAAAQTAGLTYDADHFNKRGAGEYGAKMFSDILSVASPW